MKSLALLPILALLTSIDAAVDYSGHQAIRLFTNSDVTQVKAAIDTLSLATWKGVTAEGTPKANSQVDLVVPAESIASFQNLTQGLQREVLHEDLGSSIADEGRMVAFAGTRLPLSRVSSRRATVLTRT